jgi:hypothetical protein
MIFATSPNRGIMKGQKMKLTLLALLLTAGGIINAQTVPISGGGPIGPNPTVPFGPSNQTVFSMYLSPTDPAGGIGTACYQLTIGIFNYVSQTGWACALQPGQAPGSAVPTWQVIFGTRGLPSGLSTVASATSITVTTNLVNVTGGTAVATILTPATPIVVGTRVVLTAVSGFSTVTTGNINAAVTIPVGTAVPFIWNGTKWVPEAGT